jgi:uncharacterized protein
MTRVSVSMLGLLLLVGCQPAAPAQSSLPTVTMKLGSKTYTLEVAADPESRARGLMRRDSMPADHGMIFVFPKAEKLGFWMKNTRIPLDIIYIDASAKIDSVKQMKPYDTSSVYAEGDVKYAIELNQGQAAEAGIAAGQAVEIPEVARNTSR